MAPEPGKLVELNVKARPKVIVADDEQEIATLIEEWLSENYEVTVALNGKAAIQKAVWQKPSVILCDIVMPDMGGYEVARALQGNPATQEIPLIVMTAKIYDDSTVKLIKAEPNVRGFIVKPFKPSELLKMVEAVIAGQRTFAPLPASAGPAPSPAAAARPGAPEFVSPPRPTAPPPAAAPVEDPRQAQRAVDRSESTVVIQQPVPPAHTVTPRAAAADFPQPGPLHAGHLPEGDKKETPVARVLRLGLRLAVKGLFLAVLLFAGGELASRWAVRISGEPFLPPLRTARKATMPYQFEPGGQWRAAGVDYRINSWGLRGKDFPLVAPAGVSRVLVLGGSSVFGPGIDESALLAERLGERLGASVQVINAGQWALSPAEQWAYFEDEGFQFRSEIVVWVLETRPEEGPTGEGLRRLARMGASMALARHSQLVRLAVLVWGRSGPRDAPEDIDQLVERARTFAKSHDSRLLIWTSAASGASRGPGRGPWPVRRAAEGFGALMADRVMQAIQPALAESPGQN